MAAIIRDPISIAEAGFGIIPNVLRAEDLEATIAEFYARNPPRTRAGVRHALKYPEITRLASDPRLVDLASEVLSDNAVPYRATFFDKSPGSNWLVVWHQDTALPLLERREVAGWGPWSMKDGVLYAHAPASALSKVTALRVHFDDSNADNGPLRVLPNTHESVYADDEINEVVRGKSPISCTVAKGGIVAMRPLIVHSSAKAISNAPRRVLHIEYATNRVVGDGLELAIA